MLTGSYICWDSVTGETKRSPRENLVVVNSIFGWLNSGPIKCNKQEKDKIVTLAATHMLKVGCYEANNEKGFNENISTFYGLRSGSNFL